MLMVLERRNIFWHYRGGSESSRYTEGVGGGNFWSSRGLEFTSTIANIIDGLVTHSNNNITYPLSMFVNVYS
jgi:hypothetical protein